MIRRCKFPRKVAAHEAIGRLPKAPVAGRVFGAALEYFACSVLLILGDVLGLVDGAPKASSAAKHLPVRRNSTVAARFGAAGKAPLYTGCIDEPPW